MHSEDKKILGMLIGTAIGLLAVLVTVLLWTEPECPQGTTKVYRHGWYCTVPPLPPRGFEQ
jgi:hypothetical protein